jgi:hypothetical protein
MMLGILSIATISYSSRQYDVFVAPMIVGLPLLDLAVAMIRRFYKAYGATRSLPVALGGMTHADNEHIHHRLIHRGLSHGETVGVLALFCTGLGLAAIGITVLPVPGRLVVMVYVALLCFWLLNHLSFFYRLTTKNPHEESTADDGPSTLSVAVIGADEVLRHALTSFRQNMVKFSFFDHSQVPRFDGSYGSVVVNNRWLASLPQDMSLVSAIGREVNTPVLLATDDPEEARRLGNGACGRLLFAAKPLYVPLFVEELVHLARTGSIDDDRMQKLLKQTTKIRILAKSA